MFFIVLLFCTWVSRIDLRPLFQNLLHISSRPCSHSNLILLVDDFRLNARSLLLLSTLLATHLRGSSFRFNNFVLRLGRQLHWNILQLLWTLRVLSLRLRNSWHIRADGWSFHRLFIWDCATSAFVRLLRLLLNIQVDNPLLWEVSLVLYLRVLTNFFFLFLLDYAGKAFVLPFNCLHSIYKLNQSVLVALCLLLVHFGHLFQSIVPLLPLLLLHLHQMSKFSWLFPLLSLQLLGNSSLSRILSLSSNLIILNKPFLRMNSNITRAIPFSTFAPISLSQSMESARAVSWLVHQRLVQRPAISFSLFLFERFWSYCWNINWCLSVFPTHQLAFVRYYGSVSRRTNSLSFISNQHFVLSFHSRSFRVLSCFSLFA